MSWTADDSTITADLSGFTADGGMPHSPPICVQAVSVGWFNGLLYQPGDVFLLHSTRDLADCTKNYEIGGAEYATGWMQVVNINTPLYRAADYQGTPTFPPADSNRRFVL